MSLVYKGKVTETEVSKNSRGGTEMMRDRLLNNVNPKLLEQVAIHFSRPREMPADVPNILYCHDMAGDPENSELADGGHVLFDLFVFVSAWQRDQYINQFNIPYEKCTVIYNAIETQYEPVNKPTDIIKFVYHTTPHRGLELLVPIFEALCEKFDNIQLDVYSSFKIYGWENRDVQYLDLFNTIEQHPKMNYHGAVPNEEVIAALKESHIFLYPNIWQETSCIALIEAIRSQMICIHPNYGALPETGANATIMYDYQEDDNQHANYAFSVISQILEVMAADKDYFAKFTTSDRFNLARNDIQTFKIMWEANLANVIEKKAK